ncbi:MAG TPA: hypothetical protein PKA62_03300, partial [Thermoanaerobaculia bacterium]|nr:hypothetical protein [Thermoanaerobaculia bacterium]
MPSLPKLPTLSAPPDPATVCPPCGKCCRYVAVGIDGTIGDKWTYRAYYDHGELKNDQWLDNQRITANFNRAVDSVLVGGTPVCRVNADADPANDDPACVPINIL